MTARCLFCGYDIGRAAPDRCPECGAAFDDDARAASVVRHRVLAGCRSELKRHALAWACVVAIYTISAGIMCRSVQNTLAGFVLMVGVIAGSVVAGLVVSRLAVRHHRPFVVLAWMRTLWWMHGPWLVISVCAATIMATALIDRLLDLKGQLVIWTALAGLPIWFLTGFAFLFRAMERLSAYSTWWSPWMSARGRLVKVVLTLGVIGVLLGAGLLGLIGGAFSVDVALEIVGDEIWF